MTQLTPGKPPSRGAAGRLFDFGWYIFPILLVAAAHFIPPLAARVFQPPPNEWMLNVDLGAALPWALLVQFAVAMVWVIGDFFFVADMGASVRMLRVNTAASIVVALGLSILVTWRVADHQLPWGYVIPWLAAVVDALITGDRAINNAAQKPIIHPIN